jgi:hypothetical protein
MRVSGQFAFSNPHRGGDGRSTGCRRSQRRASGSRTEEAPPTCSHGSGSRRSSAGRRPSRPDARWCQVIVAVTNTGRQFRRQTTALETRSEAPQQSTRHMYWRSRIFAFCVFLRDGMLAEVSRSVHLDSSLGGAQPRISRSREDPSIAILTISASSVRDVTTNSPSQLAQGSWAPQDSRRSCMSTEVEGSPEGIAAGPERPGAMFRRWTSNRTQAGSAEDPPSVCRLCTNRSSNARARGDARSGHPSDYRNPSTT